MTHLQCTPTFNTAHVHVQNESMLEGHIHTGMCIAVCVCMHAFMYVTHGYSQWARNQQCVPAYSAPILKNQLIYIYIYIYTYTYVYLCVCVRVYVSVCIHIYMYIYTHTHIYTYIYIHTHTHSTCLAREDRARARERERECVCLCERALVSYELYIYCKLMRIHTTHKDTSSFRQCV